MFDNPFRRPATAPRLSTGRKLLFAIGLLLCVTLCGVFGFHTLVPGNTWVESLFMTVITLSTVGYEWLGPQTPAGMIFAVTLIFGGVASLSLVISLAAGVVVEDVLSKEIGRKRMDKKIANLRQHVILCGYGRMGSTVAEILQRENTPFVVIDRNETLVEEALRRGCLVLSGDATHDETLGRAGIEHARSVVAVTSSDAENLFITLSARQLNPSLPIVTRAEDEASVAKLRRAGADRVITANQIGSIRLAHAALRPTVIDFTEALAGLRDDETGFRMEELTVEDRSEAAGQSLVSLNLSQRTGALIVSIMGQDHKLAFNPSGKTTLSPGDTVIAIGNAEHFARLRTLLTRR